MKLIEITDEDYIYSRILYGGLEELLIAFPWSKGKIMSCIPSLTQEQKKYFYENNKEFFYNNFEELFAMYLENNIPLPNDLNNHEETEILL